MRQKLHKLVFGFRTKVTVVAVLSLLLVTSLSNLFIYRYSLDAQFQQLRKQLEIVAGTAALLVDGDALVRVPLDASGVQSVEYRTIAGQLQRIKATVPGVKYIYTLRKTDKPDVWQFVVDLDTELKRAGKKEITAYPGDKYQVGRFPEMVTAFNGPTADKKLSQDEWGTSLSGYAPVRDLSGTAVAVLGVDMDARDVYLAQRNIRHAALWVFLTGILFSAGLGVFLSRSMTARIRKLIEGTRRLSAGDLAHRVQVKGHDEIGELSHSFDQMAASLSESRKRLEEYFFRMVQSLVRMLEAKDKYTQGHSERVGAYAKRIALKMGYPREQAEMLWTAGELHDIGKLAVHEHILNKKEKLTDEEWEIIRQHPVIGAEALKPVCFNEIIMAAVYSHHERPDGTGYPQKLKGDQISVFASIIAVADAYDAMTTTRPYRQSMERKAALEEVKKHAGTQFHPAVVAAFIEVIEKEPQE